LVLAQEFPLSFWDQGVKISFNGLNGCYLSITLKVGNFEVTWSIYFLNYRSFACQNQKLLCHQLIRRISVI
jgi:hypothetical protein